ncbi:Hpt domain-containing protein [Roseovarius aestuariivivens]|uniref:Hpt domain-containing protein n=1 Tax=Roseovarius aestuariivivens TaxID=1888910 RepID=UPI001080D686|nr:Hpt domain-containing protein [Roseovarius aestuariivivens]
MIDWAQVAALRDEIGPDAFDEVIEIFLEEVDTEIATLRDDPDPSKVEARLHFLKGSALNLGFADFSELCARGERLAASGQPEQAEITQILSVYDASRHTFLAGLDARLAG